MISHAANLVTASTVSPLIAQVDSIWQLFPAQSSTTARDVDWVFWFITWISIAFWAAIVIAMVWFVFRYHRRRNDGPQHSPHHSTALELTWSVLPSFLLVLMFYWGFTGYENMKTPPSNTYVINVTGQKWNWNFQYPNGHIDSDLYVPANTPVELMMTSTDVIHSLFIPAFRVKQDVVPGRYATTWFEATSTGEYNLFCTEYCGTEHSDMLAKVFVYPEEEFPAVLAEISDIVGKYTKANEPLWKAGAELYVKRGCASCHTVDGTQKQGPTFLKSFGTMRDFTDGSKGEMDPNYIRESILEPQAKIRAGFQPVMPTFQGLLKDEEIGAIIDFLRHLQDPTPEEQQEIFAFLEDPRPREAEEE